MLSEYKTHITLEVEGGLSSNQDHYNFVVTFPTRKMKCTVPILYKQSQCEEQNEQVNTNKHHIQDQLSILCVHQCTESGVNQLIVVSTRCSKGFHTAGDIPHHSSNPAPLRILILDTHGCSNTPSKHNRIHLRGLN